MARDDTVLWEKQLPFDVFQLIGLGNNGHLYICSPQGLWVYTARGREPDGPLARWSRAELLSTSSQLGAVQVSADGTRLCLERTTRQTRTSQKIFEFLASVKVENDSTLHEVIFHNVAEDSINCFYRALSNSPEPQCFLWAASPEFDWIVMAEAHRSEQIKFTIAHVTSQTIYQEFAIFQLRIHDLRVSREGMAMMDVSNGTDRGIITVDADGKKSTLTVPTDFRVLHLGKDFVALKTQPVPFLIVKGFDDSMKLYADMRGLDRLEVDFELQFNQQDAIDLISYGETGFKVVHSNLDFIETDARRWERMAEQKEELAAAPPPPHEVRESAPLSLEIPQRPASPAASYLDRPLIPYRPQRRERAPLTLEGRRTTFDATDPEPEEPTVFGVRPAFPGAVYAAPDSQPAPPETPAPSSNLTLMPEAEGERQRAERLLDMLEERFLMGQVSEPTYLELREKYRARLVSRDT
ncbi:MAG: hypothetical protein FJX76_19320 [Armatimonadetes bacterium]|nr:hypothetical protein [Armatimonadota bacterium]